MKIIVDGEVRDWHFDPSKSLEQAVAETNRLLLQDEKKIVVQIKLDDYDETLDTELTWDEVPVEKINQISLETEPLVQSIHNHLDTGLKYLEESRNSIGVIVGNMLSGDVNSAMEALKDTIEKLIWFFNLLTQIGNSGVLDMETLKVKEEAFKDFVVRFNSTLLEISDSMANQDTTLINDFLEYELEPAIGDLIGLIPSIKEIISEKIGGTKD